jgi:CO/xanthine dehydrogenase Mo-binding subunit
MSGSRGAAVGVRARRVGGVERVTGRQRFAADMRLEKMLHVKLVSVGCAHAKLLEISTGLAKRVEGVCAVLTADDLAQPLPRYGPVFQDRPILAVSETKYHGEPVAVVAAESEDAAEEAASLVRVEYEELPSVLSIEGALAPGAPLVQSPSLRPGDPLAFSNVLREWNFGWGDVGRSSRDVVVDCTYTFPMVTHFAIEPHACLVAPEDGGLLVVSPVQHPFVLQNVIARVVGLPLAKVRVVAPDPGGAFGGKQHAKFEPLLAFLALRTGRPVRLVLSLEETFQAGRRSSFEIRVRSGFSAEGRVCFHDIDCKALIGAYADIAPRVISKASYFMCGPYRVPNARVRVRALLSHTPPATAFRGFGTPQVSWAIESQMDEAARQLRMDRLDIRLANLARRGEELVPGDRPADGDWRESVRRAAEWIRWGSALPPGRGRGLAVAIKASATSGASYAIVRLLRDGSVTVLAGTSDMGQGARTVLSQVASQELGIPMERISIVLGDTGIVPFDLQTSASRSTVFMGTAVQRACTDIKSQLGSMAARLFEVPEADVSVEAGLVRLGQRQLSYEEVLMEAFGEVGGEVIGLGSRRGEHVGSHALGGPPAFYEFNCTAVEVEVDRETGELLILRHVSVADVGKALNPAHVEAQDEGAAVMGLGHTQMEQLLFDDHGRIRNLGALDYRVPTFKDVPVEMRSLIVENEDGPGPYGSKGVGEGGLLAVAPAVAAAVAEATGVVVRDLPLTAERVWEALRSARVDNVEE